MNKKCNQQCEGCAFKKGTNANQELLSVFKAQLAVMTPIPFYCHSTMENWKETNPQMDLDQKREAIQNGMSICEGWKSRVKELAETGYYTNNDVRENGIIALAALEFYSSGNLSEKNKKSALDLMKRNCAKLFDRVKKFNAEFIVSIKERIQNNDFKG